MKLPQSVTRTIGRTILQTKKNSPHLFFAAGIVGVLTSTALACRATLKLDKSLDEIKTDIDSVKEYASLAEKNGGKYTEQEYYKDLGKAYSRSAIKIGRMYGPSVVIGAASVGCLTGSHVQLARRNAAITAAFAAISQAYEDYRERVREEIGEKRELEIYRDMHDEEIEDEKGKKHIVKVSKNPRGFSPYARLFNDDSPYWKNSAELNRIYLQHQENYANERLRSYGHLLLNDVYDALGFERSEAGCVVGWLSRGDGDGYISFGLFEPTSTRFINGLEECIWLDFNVDGVVYNMIEKER